MGYKIQIERRFTPPKQVNYQLLTLRKYVDDNFETGKVFYDLPSYDVIVEFEDNEEAIMFRLMHNE